MSDQSVTRRVVWQAKCRRGMCDWTGPERDAKYVASFDLAGHTTDRHGGSERVGALDAPANVTPIHGGLS
jgi:hypothetical protein